MKKEAFKLLHNMEDSWWYRGRAKVASNVLKRFFLNRNNEKILDWGSGYGGMIGVLGKYGSVSAFEPDQEARLLSESRGYKQIFSTPDEALHSGEFSLIVLFDVLEHVEDDVGLVDALFKNLSKNGYIMITVPAYSWLWSKHDVEHQHYRRYSRKKVKEILTDAGFKVCYTNYWNTLLFIPAAIMRLFGFSGAGSLKTHSLLNKVFGKIISVESSLSSHVSLPFGTGIIAVARKK